MHAVRNLFRRLAGALVALTLAMVVAGPALDALVCGDEGATSVAAAAGPADLLSEIDDGGPGHADGAPHQACVHGHCHHGFQSAPIALADALMIEGGDERHALPTPARLATRNPAGLERPPRA